MSDRARQFMPFAALKGYYDLIREKERIVVPKKELTEDSAEILSRKMSLVTKGMMVKVIYYLDGEYVSLEGMVSGVDFDARKLTVVKTRISFDDISDISGSEIDSLAEG